jgi:hypothetical protein
MLKTRENANYNGSVKDLPMDSYRRGLHSHLGAGAKTSLGACITELKY